MGSNNLIRNNPLQVNSYADLRSYIELTNAKNIKIIMATIPPYSDSVQPSRYVSIGGITSDRIAVYNSLLQQVVSEFPGIQLLDLNSELEPNWNSYTWDGLHISSDAYKIVARKWADGILLGESLALFSEPAGQRNCTVGTGYIIPHGIINCSCAATSGDYYLCQDGTFQHIVAAGITCAQQTENHSFIKYHCPINQTINDQTVCKHSVTGTVYNSSFCP